MRSLTSDFGQFFPPGFCKLPACSPPKKSHLICQYSGIFPLWRSVRNPMFSETAQVNWNISFPFLRKNYSLIHRFGKHIHVLRAHIVYGLYPRRCNFINIQPRINGSCVFYSSHFKWILSRLLLSDVFIIDFPPIGSFVGWKYKKPDPCFLLQELQVDVKSY